jgi:hypothetical protein
MSVGYQNGGKSQQPEARTGAQGPETADWDSLKGDVGDIASAAVERGRTFIDSAREQATGYVDRRKDDVAQSVTDFAHTLREATSSFDDRPNIRAIVDSAAQGLDQFADSIRERTVNDILGDVEQVMRRRPAAVAAVTVAIGFLTARFIKASADGLHDRQDYGEGRMRHTAGGPARQQRPQAARGSQAGT